MPTKKRIRIILALLIFAASVQFFISLYLFIPKGETYPFELKIVPTVMMVCSFLIFAALHFLYSWLTRAKDGVIKRLDNALATSLKENEELEGKKSDLEMQLRHSQKLDSIGSLAHEIAHDFNNLLSPILGYSDLALSRLSKDDPLFLYINEIVRTSAKAKDQVEQILKFTQRQKSDSYKTDLNGIIEETITVFRPLIPSYIDIKLFLEEIPIHVKIDREGINQILVNLCTNSWQAMEKQGGTLTVRSFLWDEKTAAMSVEDTGTGMDEEIKQHIFEPFYSTRTDKDSSGLGLSVAEGILSNSGGRIEVESTPGIGSTFTVFLPLNMTENKKIKSDYPGMKSKYILLVDDDENITSLIRTILSELDYKYDYFNNSIKALSAFRDNPWKYNLVLSDLTMPGMTGTEMKKEMQIIRDDIPFLIMTGYGNGLELSNQKILKKPFVKKELVDAIEELVQ